MILNRIQATGLVNWEVEAETALSLAVWVDESIKTGVRMGVIKQY
jgi:hypothetical protein